MKKLFILLCLISFVVFADSEHHYSGVTTNITNNYYGDSQTEVDVSSNKYFNVSTSMGLAASGIKFRSRESLQWGVSMAQYEGVGSLGFGLSQQITDNKLLLNGTIVTEDTNNTYGWVVGISGGFW